ncbi:hypothetical protein HMPREF1624_03931 [Sporothrix schenckii ATCC 58251]|uniref:AAA+ ATPase domain-containing protein n=1 Tax=Sporothrix schenckii (strain ATCC 58251 / de Perez 2211183) TaxID=1391915 RepID=U7Q062_SPOS1|nr:hypothetical protein HMPREF1624_03931 [Sporothrix schenckii ATCC 58251]
MGTNPPTRPQPYSASSTISYAAAASVPVIGSSRLAAHPQPPSSSPSSTFVASSRGATPPALITTESQSGLAESVETAGFNDEVDVVEIVEEASDGLPGAEACDDDDADKDGEDDNADGDKSDRGSLTGRRSRRKKRTESPVEPPRPPIIPKVRRTNYEGFKNYFSEEESVYAIEVLEAGYDIKDEVSRELLKRGGRQYRHVATISNQPRLGTVTDEIWIQRVRIQSSYILAHLRPIMTSSMKADKPRTFFRPFYAFIHYQPKVKEALEELRQTVAERKANPKSPTDGGAKGSEKEDQEADVKNTGPTYRRPHGKGRRRQTSAERRRRSRSASVTSSSGSESGSGSEADDAADATIPEELFYSEEAIDHLQCYVDFVDKNIMHLADSYKGTTKQRIRYSDLAYLFHPGDVVYSPTQAEFGSSTNYTAAKPSPAVYQPIWKIQYTNPPSISDSKSEEYDKNHRFYISCFYIDFDGKNYGPVKYRFDVQPYEGEWDIKTLPVYPIRYHISSSKGTSNQGPDRLRPAGKDFQTYVEARHLYYRGWTLTTSPNGDTLTDNAGELMKHPEHIDSSVIVDFKAALQALPSWKPTFKDPSRMDQEWTTSLDDKIAIIQWSDSKRTRVVRRTTEITQMRDGAHAIETNDYADQDPFLVAYMAGNTDTSYELSEENLQLLPGRVMAYVLRDRKFVQLDVHYLSKIEQQSNVFENLKIAPQHKEMVMALVDSHFRKKESKSPRHFSLGQDLIQGKGEGLVILLHGVPGVGKTATAEAVAQSNQQPLFVITCGDLGFTPKEVERSLEEIFRLAHLWDCILLLDEADIFLAERTRDDLKRNALVSVFLRVLEYYSGILFLTTNRVGTLDEAFKSRIHMSLYYPPLDRQQTLQIFEMNIDRIEEIDRKRHESRKRDQSARRKEIPSRSRSVENGGAGSDNDDNGRHRGREDKDKEKDTHKDELAHHLVVNREKVMEFARNHFDRNILGRWNGRQIRNAFQIASSLAFYDKRQSWIQRQGDRSDNSKIVPELGAAVLSDEQFLKVARATLRFEKYMIDARGGDDKQAARIDRIRADDHVTAEDPDFSSSASQRERERDRDRDRDKQLQTRRLDDDFRGSSSTRFGGPSSPAPQTPQSGRRGGVGDDYDRRRRGPDDRSYDVGSRYGGDRDRDYDQGYDGDRDYDRNRRDRDYNQGGGGFARGGAGLQDFRRRNGGEYDGGFSPRSNAGYDRYLERDRERDRDPYDDRDRDRERERARDRDRDDAYYRDGRAPPSSARSRGGGGGDFDKRVRSRNRTPTRSERDRPGSSFNDGTPTQADGGSSANTRGSARDVSPDRDRITDDDYDMATKHHGTGASSYQSPPPSTGTPRGGSRGK